MKEKEERIKRMVVEGKVSEEEGKKLLDALKESEEKEIKTRERSLTLEICPKTRTNWQGIRFGVMILGYLVAIPAFLYSRTIPEFKNVFSDLEAPLPLLTKFFITLSDLVRTYWYVSSILLVGLLVLIIVIDIKIKSLRGRAIYEACLIVFFYLVAPFFFIISFFQPLVDLMSGLGR